MNARVQREQAGLDARPGRACPVSYRYSPRVFDRQPQVVAETLYVVGGLYGNVEALEAVKALVAREPGAVVVFNGDFHWFDVDDAAFERVTREVLLHPALRGNVETEIGHDDEAAGCGCAYPADVSDAEVSRSNAILTRLRETARRHPRLRERLRELPMHLSAQVGDARIGIVHGDACSLAGWGFARDRIADPRHQRWIESVFREARVDVFASTHTCLPALRLFRFDRAAGIVANNGAAGMPNFPGTRFGLATRISLRPFSGERVAGGLRLQGAHVDAVRIEYDHPRWVSRFLANWPAGSAAHDSYARRILEGPRP